MQSEVTSKDEENISFSYPLFISAFTGGILTRDSSLRSNKTLPEKYTVAQIKGLV